MSRKFNKMMAHVLIWCMAVVSFPWGATSNPVYAEEPIEVPVAASAAAAGGATPDRIRDGVILHAFDWNLSVIEENLQAIAAAGFTAIQTSPVMGSSTGGANWASSYSPRNMIAGGNGNKFGDRNALASLTSAAKAFGIKVIVDVIPNHMGSAANSDAPWNDSTYFHDVTGSVGYNDRFLLTQPEMISGLRDLDTHSKFVQDSYIAYLKDMIDAGVSGFRYDAIKHIELDDDLPSPASIAAGATNARYADGKFASDYVKNVTGAAKAYLQEKGKENFQYGEVLQGGDPKNDRMQGYAKYIDLTASMYGHHVRGVLEVGDIGRIDKWADYDAEGLTADRLVPWVESHDTYNNEGESLNFSPKQIRQGWAMIAARKDASPLFFARNINADGTRSTGVRTADNVENSKPQWTHPEVVAVNKFHNAMAGRDENLVSLGNNAVMIERGTTADGGGAVLVNTGTSDRVLGSVPVKFMKDGFYVNALNPSNVFTVSSGRISGTIPGNPAKTSSTDTNANPGLVVLMDRNEAASAILAALPSDDDVIAGNSFTGSQLRLRMSAIHVTDAVYAVNNGEAVSFAHDDIITVSANYNDPITVTLMGRAAGGAWITSQFTYTRVEPEKAVVPPVEEPTHVNVYFSINRNANFQAWAGYSYGIRAYTFNPELFGGWPGGTMTRMKYNGADTHWYKIKMPRAAVGGIIFNTQNNSGTQQQTNQPAITASMLNNDQLYFYGTGASNFNINGSSDSGNNARANWDTAFAAGNNIGYAASGIFPPGRNGVIFDTSGGSSVANQYVRDGDKAARPTTDPTRSGYLFDGNWYTDPSFTQAYDFNKPVVNTLGEDYIYAMTLYAGWIKLDADKYLVEFNSQGGSPVMSIPNVVSGAKIAAPQQPPVRAGYTFKGWFKDSSYNNAWNFGTDTVTSATTLFAKWELVSYTISYRDGDVTAVMPGSEPTTYTIVTPAFNLSDPSPKDGYAFDGWFTDPQFRPSSRLTGVAEGSVGDLTLYARFKANTYSIALDPQSGTGGTASISVSHGGKLPLGIAPPEREGYSFKGYFADAEGKGQQYYNSGGVRVYAGNWTTASVGSLYAHWALADDPDAAAVAAAAAVLEVGYAAGNDAAHVTQDVTLPKTGSDDVAISWSSDQPAVIGNNGAVVRPLAGEADVTVTLTATLTKGEATDTKIFTVIVKAISPEAAASLSGPSTVYTGQPVHVTASVASVTYAFNTLEVTVNYDPAKLEFATVANEDGTLSLAEGAIAASHAQLQLLGTSVKPDPGRIHVKMTKTDDSSLSDGTLFRLQGTVKTGASAGKTSLSLSELKVSLEGGSSTVDTAGATVDIVIMDQADRTALGLEIAAAQRLHDEAVEGTSPGQYPAGSKAALQQAITAAAAVYANPAATEQQLSDAAAALVSAANGFRNAVIASIPGGTYVPPPVAVDNKDVTAFNEDDLKRLGEDRSLAAGKDATQVLLPIQASDLTGNKPIRIQFNAISVELPAEVLREMQASAAGQPTDKTKIALKVVPVAQSKVDAFRNSNPLTGAAVKVVGSMYELSLSVVTDNNEVRKFGEFAKPLTLRFALEGTVDKNLTGVYFIGDHNQLQYAGGTIDGSVITAQVKHFSAYAVLEINKTFNDVSDANWASPAIKSLAAKLIVTGTTDTAFSPDRSVSRAEFAALLARSLGLQAAGSNPFKDVKSNAWYADAVTAVYEAGIVTGRGGQMFEPAQSITRQEAAVMLMRAYALRSGNHEVPAAAGSPFADQASISAWAQDAVTQARALGLLNGKGVNKFVPHTSLTRAEAAQIIDSLLNM
ncbi:InlB B-repeat-containing protein [Cohnella sp. 56]|uniref:InlB B-repeat-containing protein n=1 Tax=Cohnella sp. 56 TaxID=3113722 RepID=UPI0030E9230B